MIKIKLMLKEGITRRLLESIYQKLLRGLDCSLYLCDISLPIKLYKKIVFDENTNINIIDDFGNTPLIWSCGKNEILKVKILLNHPDIDVNIKNKKGDSALDFIDTPSLIKNHPSYKGLK